MTIDLKSWLEETEFLDYGIDNITKRHIVDFISPGLPLIKTSLDMLEYHSIEK